MQAPCMMPSTCTRWRCTKRSVRDTASEMGWRSPRKWPTKSSKVLRLLHLSLCLFVSGSAPLFCFLSCFLSVCLSVCIYAPLFCYMMSVCLHQSICAVCVCLSVYLSVCLSVCLSVSMFLCVAVLCILQCWDTTSNWSFFWMITFIILTECTENYLEG